MLTGLFSSNSTITSEESDRKFALLTSVKSNYYDKFEPILTQGTILLQNQDTFWLCIQPKCDSVRIIGNREFLMASLKLIQDSSKGFDFLIFHNGNYLHFEVNYSIYKTHFFKFKGNKDKVVRGLYENDKIIFKGETIMQWLGELKSDFAQYISNNFASYLSRVGMDHSEWLRRS